MNEINSEPPESPGAIASTTTPATRRRLTPAKAGLAFLLLMMIALAANIIVGLTGPTIAWETDLPKALAKARSAPGKQHVFLYLYRAGDPVAERNEREVFAKRLAREPLARLVCCRIAIEPNDALALRYAYRDAPLFLLLDRDGTSVSRTEGPVDQAQFVTYVEKASRDPGR